MAVPSDTKSTPHTLTPLLTTRSLLTSANSIAIPSFLADPLVARFSRLGLNLLGNESEVNLCSSSSIVWTGLLPKFWHLSPTVYAASAALGAAYEMFPTSRALQGGDHPSAKNQYLIALGFLRQDILLQTHGPTAVFLASIILAGVEALQRNLTNAFMHIQGAFKIYTECIREVVQKPKLPNEVQIEDAEQLALNLVVQQLDVQNVTYRLSHSLNLGQSHLSQRSLDHTTGPVRTEQAESAIVHLLHACYSFSSMASAYKYLPRSHIPSDVVIHQGRYIAQLQQWLTKIEAKSQRLKPGGNRPRQETSPRPSLLPLRIQCLSTIIYLSSILSPYEAIFDSLHHLFQKIVDATTVVLSSRKVSGVQTQFRFRPISSLSQPLFLTVMKCRDPGLRRKAIELLALTEREGPWDPEILVAVAERAVVIEEQFMRRNAGGREPDGLEDELEKSHDEDQKKVPERARLHGCGMGYISTDSGAPVDGVIPNNGNARQIRTIEFRFRRCADIEKMIEANGESTNASGNDSDYWETWDERIEMQCDTR
jgi:hypothetical protein